MELKYLKEIKFQDYEGTPYTEIARVYYSNEDEETTLRIIEEFPELVRVAKKDEIVEYGSRYMCLLKA